MPPGRGPRGYGAWTKRLLGRADEALAAQLALVAEHAAAGSADPYVNGDYIVIGSAGGAKAEPQWFRNVRVTRRARIELGHETYDAEVLIPEAAARDLLWQDVVLKRAPFFAKYQAKAGRIIPVAVLAPRSAALRAAGPN